MKQTKTKLDVYKETREFAAKALANCLCELLSKNTPISEVSLRDRLILELRKNQDIFPDG